MDDELDSLVVRVRADTGAFARDVAAMRGSLEGTLATGVTAAGRVMEGALDRFVRTGKVGFDDLRRLALSAMGDIASATLNSGPAAGGGGLGGLLGPILNGVLGAFGGAPGRATGGPVVGGRAYMVGERGPELFVPTASGQVVANGGKGARGPVSITVNVAAPRDAGPEFMRKSGAQMARAVRTAMLRAEGDA